MITPHQRRTLLIADRSRQTSIVTAAVIDVLNANPETTLHDCEIAFRDGAAQSYIIADGGDNFRIVFGIVARRDALLRMGIDVREHMARLKQRRE